MGFALSDIQLSSTAFENGGAIPKKYTGEGDAVSPQLKWQNIPEGTKSFAVLCHDPDAPLISASGAYGFVHWSIYNIPGNATELTENCDNYTVGINDFGNKHYGGPMPPEGHGLHRYYFWILALDIDLQLPEGLTQQALLSKLEAHCIGMNRLVGTYQRS